jgi:hypothetical protein
MLFDLVVSLVLVETCQALVLHANHSHTLHMHTQGQNLHAHSSYKKPMAQHQQPFHSVQASHTCLLHPTSPKTAITAFKPTVCCPYRSYKPHSKH